MARDVIEEEERERNFGKRRRQLPRHRKGIDAVYESGYVTGRAKEADFWKLMRSRFHFSETDAALTGIILDLFTLRPEMIDLVRDLRGRGLTCAILSDQTDWLNRLDQRHDFYREFDRVYCSYRLGKSKREPSLFDEVVSDLAVRPGEALFVDDDPGNVERARSRGLRAVCCDTATQCRAGLQDMLGQGSSGADEVAACPQAPGVMHPQAGELAQLDSVWCTSPAPDLTRTPAPSLTVPTKATSTPSSPSRRRAAD